MRKRPPDGPRWSNCLFWAIACKYGRGRGGFITWRRSRHSRWKLHFIYARTLNGPWFGYVPHQPRPSVVAIIHGCRFRGHIEVES